MHQCCRLPAEKVRIRLNEQACQAHVERSLEAYHQVEESV